MTDTASASSGGIASGQRGSHAADSGHGNLSTGGTVGVAVGSACGGIALLVLLWLLWRKCARRKQEPPLAFDQGGNLPAQLPDGFDENIFMDHSSRGAGGPNTAGPAEMTQSHTGTDFALLPDGYPVGVHGEQHTGDGPAHAGIGLGVGYDAPPSPPEAYGLEGEVPADPYAHLDRGRVAYEENPYYYPSTQAPGQTPAQVPEEVYGRAHGLAFSDGPEGALHRPTSTTHETPDYLSMNDYGYTHPNRDHTSANFSRRPSYDAPPGGGAHMYAAGPHAAGGGGDMSVLPEEPRGSEHSFHGSSSSVGSLGKAFESSVHSPLASPRPSASPLASPRARQGGGVGEAGALLHPHLSSEYEQHWFPRPGSEDPTNIMNGFAHAHAQGPTAHTQATAYDGVWDPYAH